MSKPTTLPEAHTSFLACFSTEVAEKKGKLLQYAGLAGAFLATLPPVLVDLSQVLLAVLLRGAMVRLQRRVVLAIRS